jgi:hypothetical protein
VLSYFRSFSENLSFRFLISCCSFFNSIGNKYIINMNWIRLKKFSFTFVIDYYEFNYEQKKDVSSRMPNSEFYSERERKTSFCSNQSSVHNQHCETVSPSWSKIQFWKYWQLSFLKKVNITNRKIIRKIKFLQICPLLTQKASNHPLKLGGDDLEKYSLRLIIKWINIILIFNFPSNNKS